MRSRMGRRRRINVHHDGLYDYSKRDSKRWYKRRTVKFDRLDDQDEMNTQLDDLKFDTDPDGWD